MTIVNKGAVPSLMTHGFPGSNINPSQAEINDTYRMINFISSDFGECKSGPELELFRVHNFLASYPNNQEYADFWTIVNNKELWDMNPRKIAWLTKQDDSEQNYFVVEIYSHTAFAIFPLRKIAGNYFDRIVSGEIHLMIVMSLHGYHDMPERVYQDIIIRYGIDPKNVTVQQESRDMMEALEIASYKYQLPKFNLIWVLEMEHHMQQEILEAIVDTLPAWQLKPNTKWNPPAILNNFHGIEYRKAEWRCSQPTSWPGLTCKTLVHKEYEKKFLSFNGAYRIGRSMLVSLFAIGKLLDKGYVSYNASPSANEIGGVEIFDRMISTVRFSPELHDLFLENKVLLESIDEISLDIPRGLTSMDDFTQVTPRNTSYYENTYFSVVTETSFPNHKLTGGEITEVGRILSEKIFKCIGMKHPFIVVSNPHVLELLREIGYKTFHPLIDETYDKITDPGVRLCMIVNETKKLCELEGDELKHFLTEAKEICDYNYNVLLNKTNFHYPLTE